MKPLYCLAILVLFSINSYAQTGHDSLRLYASYKFHISQPKTPLDTINCYIDLLKDINNLTTLMRAGDERPYAYVHSLVNTHNKWYNILLKEIIRISQKIKIKPAISEQARKDYVEGLTLLEDPANKKKEDYYLSVTKLYEANLLAPWWDIIYKKLGLANELAENYNESIENFKLYLLTKPSAKEARDVQDEIYIVEAKLQRKK